MHRCICEALSADPTLLDDDGSVAATLAHHWYTALDLPRALSASVQAGRQAGVGYAPAEALRHLERALQIWPRVPDAVERAGVDWTQLNVLAAEAAWSAGELNRALSVMDQVLADTESVTDRVRRAEVVERRAFVLCALGRDAEAAGQLREALALLPPLPVTVTHAVVLASLANSVTRIGEDQQGYDIARSAVDAAAAVGATAQHADALITLGVAATYLGDPPTGLAALRCSARPPSSASGPRWPGRSAASQCATPGRCSGSACASKQTTPPPHRPAPRNTRRCTPWPPPSRATRRPRRHTRR